MTEKRLLFKTLRKRFDSEVLVIPDKRETLQFIKSVRRERCKGIKDRMQVYGGGRGGTSLVVAGLKEVNTRVYN